MIRFGALVMEFLGIRACKWGGTGTLLDTNLQ